jgi:2'-5' RNA ligase
MPETDSYALWIIPVGDAYTLADNFIARLSKAYQLPKFRPHVTVLGGIRQPEAAKMHVLAGGLSPFPVRLKRRVEYLDEYFRCLFLSAYETPELMAAISKAGELFGDEGRPPFPHLSLAYGNLPMQTKQEMIRKLGLVPEIAFEARALYLVQASTEMDVSRWKVIERILLGSL